MDVLAHLDGTKSLSQDGGISIFEVVAARKMNELLGPAFEFGTALLAERYYTFFPIHRFRRFLFISIMSAVELSYLHKWGGSFSETFYGLKRIGVKAYYLSLIELVVYPTIKTTLNALYSSIHVESQINPSSLQFITIKAIKSRKAKLRAYAKLFILKFYPLFKIVEGAAYFALQTAFVYGCSKYHSPWQFLTKNRIRRITQDDYVNNEAAISANQQAFSDSLMNLSGFSYLLQFFGFNISRAGSLLSSSLPALIFLFRFREWYQTTDYSKKKPYLPIPPPPRAFKVHQDGLTLKKNGHCPFCDKDFINPAMLNGVVYCYTCIFTYMEDKGRCPVTLKAILPSEITKIYQ